MDKPLDKPLDNLIAESHGGITCTGTWLAQAITHRARNLTIALACSQPVHPFDAVDLAILARTTSN